MRTAKKSPKKPARTARAEPKRGIDPSDEAAALWELCEEHAGRPDELERAIRSAMGMPASSTHAAALSCTAITANAGMYALFLKLGSAMSPELGPYFESLANKGAKKLPSNKSYVPGALCFAGVCMGRWREFDRYVRALYGDDGPTDSFRKLELEACARVLIERHDDGDALEALRREIARWPASAARRDKTVSLRSMPFLLRRRDPVAIETLAAVLDAGSFTGQTWWLALALVDVVLRSARWPELREALGVAVTRGLGRHDFGDRATVLRAFVACGATEKALRAAVAERADARAECERCALAAGLLESKTSAKNILEATSALEALLDGPRKFGSMEYGACVSLVRAMVETNVSAANTWIERVHEATAKVKFRDEALMAWLDQARAAR